MSDHGGCAHSEKRHRFTNALARRMMSMTKRPAR
jgi:hypothetical protein